MERMCVGFLFNSDLSKVVLISKNHPEWQIGKLNGVGGHLREGEFPPKAMEREFLEEAGVEIPDWEQYCEIKGRMGDWLLHVFCAKAKNGEFEAVRSLTDEQILSCPVSVLPSNLVANVRWLIPLAADNLRGMQSIFAVCMVQ